MNKDIIIALEDFGLGKEIGRSRRIPGLQPTLRSQRRDRNLTPRRPMQGLGCTQASGGETPDFHLV